LHDRQVRRFAPSAVAICDAKQCRHHKDLPCHSSAALSGRFESAGAFSYLVPGSSASVLASASFIASMASLDAWGGQPGLSPFRNSGKTGRQGRASRRLKPMNTSEALPCPVGSSGAGEQPRVPKDFRRQAHSFGAEGASRQEASELKLSTPDVKGQNLGEGQRDLPLPPP
jgi:hypothetical protein